MQPMCNYVASFPLKYDEFIFLNATSKIHKSCYSHIYAPTIKIHVIYMILVNTF
jgi:hypothetical protein